MREEHARPARPRSPGRARRSSRRRSHSSTRRSAPRSRGCARRTRSPADVERLGPGARRDAAALRRRRGLAPRAARQVPRVHRRRGSPDGADDAHVLQAVRARRAARDDRAHEPDVRDDRRDDLPPRAPHGEAAPGREADAHDPHARRVVPRPAERALPSPRCGERSEPGALTRLRPLYHLAHGELDGLARRRAGGAPSASTTSPSGRWRAPTRSTSGGCSSTPTISGFTPSRVLLATVGLRRRGSPMGHDDLIDRRGRREGGRPLARRRGGAVADAPDLPPEERRGTLLFPTLTLRIAPPPRHLAPVNEQLVLPLDDFLARRRPASRALAASSATATCGCPASRGSASTWTTRWRSTTSRPWTSCRSAPRSRSS